MKVIVGRPINGISVNGLEYLLDNNDNEIVFSSEENARDFLRARGYTDEQVEDFTFQDVGGEYETDNS